MDTSASLLEKLTGLLSPAGGRFSVSAIDILNPYKRIDIRPDEAFPSASVIKTPVLGALYAARDAGRLKLTDETQTKQSDIVGGSGTLQEMHTGLTITLQDLANLMIVVSDNTATNMLIDRLSVDYIHKWVGINSLHGIQIQRRLMDFEARAKGLDNLLCAGSVTDLYVKLFKGDLSGLTPDSHQEMLQILKRQQYRDLMPYLMPGGVVTATKSGSLDDAMHDSGLAILPDGRAMAAAILTQGFSSSVMIRPLIANAFRMIFDWMFPDYLPTK